MPTSSSDSTSIFREKSPRAISSAAFVMSRMGRIMARESTMLRIAVMTKPMATDSRMMVNILSESASTVRLLSLM